MENNKNKIIAFLRSPGGIIFIVFIIVIFSGSFLFFVSRSMVPAESGITPMPTAMPVVNTTKPSGYPTTDPARITSMLSFEKAANTINIMLDTGANAVSGVQLAIAYDPKLLTNVSIAPGTFFENPVVLQQKVDNDKGVISYALSAPSTATIVQGQGILAVIQYQTASGKTTSLSFLPQTKVTSLGVNTSVLKETTQIEIP